jgi:hypothetical protein
VCLTGLELGWRTAAGAEQRDDSAQKRNWRTVGLQLAEQVSPEGSCLAVLPCGRGCERVWRCGCVNGWWRPWLLEPS